MKYGQRFSLTRSAMAIAQRDARNVTIMIPEGALVELIDGPFDDTRLMDVNYDGERMLMFRNDVEHHTKVIKDKAA